MNHGYWIYATWLSFVVKYRKTALGPLWLSVGPILFIMIIGSLYADIAAADPKILIPHLAMGLITWTLLSGFVNGSTTIFQRYRAQVIQGELSLMDITMVSVFTTVLQFLHQIVVIIVVYFIYKIALTPYSLLGLVGLALLIINGIWLSVVFGIIGARYRDLGEIVLAVMRIGFLATPVIWMPSDEGRGGVMGAFLIYNPFYHFIELVRAPLLGTPIDPLSWYVVLGFTIFGSALALFFKSKFSGDIALWV